MTPTIRAPQAEAKFALAEGRAGAALALLRQQCRPDAEHPANVVSSLYYDTLPRPLWLALRLGCRLGSFSKYATCYAAALGAPR